VHRHGAVPRQRGRIERHDVYVMAASRKPQRPPACVRRRGIREEPEPQFVRAHRRPPS
jgi:hypothetical protein